MADIAVIRTGGKQYVVAPGKNIKVEKLSTKEGGEAVFPEVLLVETHKGLEVGTPLVESVKVKAKVLKHAKGKKLVVFKYKAKKRQKTKKGHRQPYTEVQITSIESNR